MMTVVVTMMPLMMMRLHVVMMPVVAHPVVGPLGRVGDRLHLGRGQASGKGESRKGRNRQGRHLHRSFLHGKPSEGALFSRAQA
jgi:hypothetical protein